MGIGTRAGALHTYPPLTGAEPFPTTPGELQLEAAKKGCGLARLPPHPNK